MNAFQRVYQLYRDSLWGEPAYSEYDRAQRQKRIEARLMAEAEYHRTLANFYTERVLSLDPDTQWWEFAEAKQKQYDHQCECLRYEARARGETDHTDIPELARGVRQQTQEDAT